MRDRMGAAVEAYRRLTAAVPGEGAAGVEAVRRRVRRRRATRQAAAGLATACALVAVGAWARSLGPTGDAVGRPGDAVAPDGRRQRVLADGSRVSWEAGAELTFVPRAGGTEARLRGGSATFRVAAQTPGERFVVDAGSFEVRVVGTLFTVDAAGRSVVVREGVVEVREPGREPRRIGAGQRWSAGRATPGSRSPELGRPAREPSASDERASPSPAAPAPAPRTRRRAEGGDRVAGAHTAGAGSRDRTPEGASAAGLAPGGARPAAGSVSDRGPERPSGGDGTGADGPAARELLARADAARSSGDARAAEEALEELLERYPGDEAAPSAAFTLARLLERTQPAAALARYEWLAERAAESPLGQEARQRAERIRTRIPAASPELRSGR